MSEYDNNEALEEYLREIIDEYENVKKEGLRPRLKRSLLHAYNFFVQVGGYWIIQSITRIDSQWSP